MLEDASLESASVVDPGFLAESLDARSARITRGNDKSKMPMENFYKSR